MCFKVDLSLSNILVEREAHERNMEMHEPYKSDKRTGYNHSDFQAGFIFCSESFSMWHRFTKIYPRSLLLFSKLHNFSVQYKYIP